MERIKLDLVPGGCKPILHASQYDDGRQWWIELLNNGVPYVLQEGDVVEYLIRKGDGLVMTGSIAYVPGATYVILVSTEQMCAVFGSNLGELKITSNGAEIGTGNFIIDVERSTTGGEKSKSVIWDLQAQVDDAVDNALENKGAAGVPFDPDDTPLESDNVQDAIVEVYHAIGDPVDTYDKQQIDEKLTAKVDSETLTENYYDKTATDDLLDNKYEQKLTQTLKVGENILTEASVVLGANWSGTLAGGFTHSSGSTEPLTFNLATTSGKAYLVTFHATNVGGTVLYVKIGSTPDVDIYNGYSDFNVGVVSDGGNLILTPTSSFTGTITNIKLREVKEDGEPVTFEAKNVNTSEKAGGLSGFWNVALGFNSFDKNENGSRNVALGYCSLQDFKSGTRNLALGTFAMNRLVSGDRNVAIGADSLWYATHATGCIAIGHNSMHGVGTDIEHNIAIGQDTMGGVTTGKNNIAIGTGAMAFSQSANATGCVSVGYESGYYSKTGNTNVGFRAGYYNRGIRNTTLGYQAGSQNYVSGDDNVFLGFNSGIDNTGGTASNPITASKSIALGQNAKVTKSNQMILGSDEITEVVICGNKKINFNNDGTVTWTQI